MIFKETKLKGVFIIEPERLEDDRGFFARTWCKREFEVHGLNSNLMQCNISFNKIKGTLRGMHYQSDPHAEAKLVRCTQGSLYDVIIDLRQNSITYKNWLAVELNRDNYKMLYIPENFAHGFLTLEDNTEVLYYMSESYYPEYARSVRWNDPAFSIRWPTEVNILSERDRNCPDFES